MKKLLTSLIFSVAMLVVAPVYALVINPAVGLADEVFATTGPGGSAFFDYSYPGGSGVLTGDDTLSITVANPFSIDVRIEDCCYNNGGTWNLLVDGTTWSWDIVNPTGADGVRNSLYPSVWNGQPTPGPLDLESGNGPFGARLFEAFVTLTLGAGTHTLDLMQIGGVPTNGYFSVSPTRPAQGVPVPGPGSMMLLLLGLGLLASAAWRIRASND